MASMIQKVLFIDPWGINNTGEYTNGICGELQNYVDLTLVTNYYFQNKTEIKNVRNWFFKHSQKMKGGFFRKLVRGMGYFCTWKKIIRLARKEKYNVVHINWLLMYKLDIRFLKKLKKYNIKIIYTAHNVIPHVNGQDYIKSLRIIYHIVDKIIVHGSAIAAQFVSIFPGEQHKIYVQNICYSENKETDYDVSNVDMAIKDRVSKYQRMILFIGNIFYGKGTDRLLHIWLHNNELSDTLLVIAGKEAEKNPEYCNSYNLLKQEAKQHDNILILDWFVSDEVANFLLDNANLIVLPYREASMSDVVFTAAEFKKPLLATKVGALNEYLNGIDGAFCVENDLQSLENKILEVNLKTIKELEELGQSFSECIKEKYSWKSTVAELFNNCYCVL